MATSNPILDACVAYATPTSIITLLLTALATVAIKRRYFSPLSDIPGPFFASVTRLWQIRTLLQGDSLNAIYDLHQKHGPFVRIAPNEVSVCHRDAPRKLLLAALPKDDWYRAGALPDYRFQTTLSITDPKAKVARSRHLLQGYTTTNLLRQEHRMDGIYAQLLDWLDRFSSSPPSSSSSSPSSTESPKPKPMNLAQFFTFTAADITGDILFSKPFGFLSSGTDIEATLARSHGIVGIGSAAGYFPWANKLVANPFMTWTGLLPFRLIFVTALTAIAERLARAEEDKTNDVLTQWFRAHAEGKLTLRDIQAQTTLGVTAGTDAMSTGFQSFVYHTIRHPDAWRRCRDEVLAARREHGRCVSRVVSFADAQTLPYLQACIKESLRLFGPLGTGLPRLAPEGGTTVGERVFPAGTALSIHP